MTKTYEFVALFSPELNDDQLENAQRALSEIIAKNKGKITSTDVWGKKVLAYAIEKHTEAHYVFYTLEMDTENVVNFDRDVRLSDATIRYLITIQDPKTLKKNNDQIDGPIKD